MELGILVAFEHITLARLPVFADEHRLGVSLRRKAARNEAELESYAIDDELARAKVRRSRESMERAFAEEASRKLAEDHAVPSRAVQ